MPIKSIFLPSHAIQGEEIPAHILWDSLSYQFIKIQLPKGIKLKEIYNVSEEMLDISDREIIVKGVELDGYLGMLFSTFKLKEDIANVNVTFSFADEKGKEIIKELKKIRLFRPELEVIEIPEIIKVDIKRKFAINRIRVKKCGQGTLIINFNTPKESQLSKRIPDSVEEFLRNVQKDLKTNLVDVKKAFPKYSRTLDEYVTFLLDGWTNYTELNRLKKIINDLTEASIENETFAVSFFKALINAVYSNIKLLTLPENLLKFLDSVLSQRVWLVQPWQTITVSDKTKTLILEILPTDLLLNTYEPIRLGPIKIKGTSTGEIEIAKLFVWR